MSENPAVNNDLNDCPSMSHNYLSAFARVAEGSDAGSNTTQAGSLPQTYHQLAAFGMQNMNPSMFPGGSPASINPIPAHSHQQSTGQQPPMGPVSQAQQWVQNMASQQRQMLPTTTNVPMPGTPLLEWTGREWVAPQQSSIAAAAAAGQQVTLPNVAGQTLSSTYTLSQLTPWNPSAQQHLDTHSQSTQQPNHSQHSQQTQAAAPVSSFPSSDGTRTSSQPAKQPRKRAPKARHKQQQHNASLQSPQQSVLSVAAQSLPLGSNRSSPEDLLSAEQLARVSGGAGIREEPPREMVVTLTQDHVDMMNSQRLQSSQPQSARPQEHEPVLAELTPVIRAPPPPQEPAKPEPPPRPVREFDGHYAVCDNCGTMSKNYLNCDFCKKEIPDNCRMYDPVKAKQEEAQRLKEKQKKVENERLLLAKLKQEQLKKLQEAQKAKVQLEKMSGTTSRGRPSKGSPTKSAAAAAAAPTTKSFYGRKVAVKDYSDDDPGWTPSSRAKSRGGGKATGPTKRGRKVKEAEVYIISSDESDEYIPTPPRATSRKVPVAGAAAGTAAGTAAGAAAAAMAANHVNLRSRIRINPKTLKPDLSRIPELYMKCTKIMMGTLIGSPKEPLHIALTGVDINMETDKESVKIRLDNRDVRECLGCTHENLPILFFRANESFGKKVREALKMIDSEQDPYYDPDSNNNKHKYIVVYLDDKLQIRNLGWRLQEVFRAISLSYQTGGVLLRFIQLHAAEHLLARITEMESQETKAFSALDELAICYGGDSDDDIEAKSPLIFEGPITRMFQYPFSPAVGSMEVTNEDYFCLYDGEFLNDVVISFYLRYLTEQVLSETDRERTFIFSSFFYTRITYPLTGKMAKDTKKTAAEKRHAGVRTWTKNVDLFSKDFIIIPINEHSHWYLAVICYPYLDGVVYQSPSSTPIPSAAVNSEPGAADDNVVSSTTPEDTQTSRDDSTLAQSGKPDPAASPTTLSESAALISQTEALRSDLFGFDDSDDDIPVKDERLDNRSPIVKRPCILIFDSLAGPGHGPVIRNLRDYLTVEWKVRKGYDRSFCREKVRGANVKCPQQNNYSDCGIYLLQYVQTFFEKPITDWSFPMKCTKDWFDYAVIKTKRAEIQSLMTKYEAEYAARPGQPKGRPRATRQSVAVAQANAVAKKPKATTHNTTVPEALGLAQTHKEPSKPEEELDKNPTDVSSSPVSTGTGDAPEVEGSNGESPLAAKKLRADLSINNVVEDGGAPSPLAGDAVKGPQVAASSPRQILDGIVSKRHPSADLFSQSSGGEQTDGSLEHLRARDSSSVEHMEVKDDSSSVELLEVQPANADVSSAEEMDHTSSAREQLDKLSHEELMQTEAPCKLPANNDIEDNEMQTEPA